MISTRNIIVFFFVATSIFWLACKQTKDPCLQPTTIPLHVGTYQPADTGSLGRDSILPAAIWGLVDSPAAYFFGAANKFTLPLSPKADSVRWYVIPDSTHKVDIDTLTFYYKRVPHFLSEACGFVYFYTLQNVRSTNFVIDSVIISKYDVNANAGIEHVKIFF